jgi:SAM-dependent methyltransferase
MTASRQSTRAGDAIATGVYRRRETCRACGGSDMELVLDLGDQPLANALLRNASEFETESFFPLELVFCRGCSLVQILDVVYPEVLFGHYLYVTGTSETIAEHNERYAAAVVRQLGLTGADLVAEIASNDGSLLSCFRSRGVRVLGIEPARNIAEIARQRGIETVGRFFDRDAGPAIASSHGRAKAIIGNNVFAHVDDPVGFLAGCRDMLTDDGRVFIECPYALDMAERGEYDTIYHEHLSYFSVTSLARCAEAAGLSIDAVERVPVHGGSIRTAFRKGGSHASQPESMMSMEREEGLTTLARWQEFGNAAAHNRVEVLELLQKLLGSGKSVAAYGAPAKGNTLLNYCGIGVDLLPWTVDRNPLKVGLFTPGMHIPVLPVETVIERRPDYLMILPWNFADEIMRQQRAYAEAGGRFIIPIPNPRIA